MNIQASILIIEADPGQRAQYRKALPSYELTCVSSGSEGLKALAGNKPDLIILSDHLSGGENRIEILRKFKERSAHVTVVYVLEALDFLELLAVCQGNKAAHYFLFKPVDFNQLNTIVTRALEESGLGEAVRLLKSLERAEKIEHNEPLRRFTERLDRQHRLLNKLRRSNGPVNISAMARAFNVARRTIHRDLFELMRRGQLHPSVRPDRAGSLKKME